MKGENVRRSHIGSVNWVVYACKDTWIRNPDKIGNINLLYTLVMILFLSHQNTRHSCKAVLEVHEEQSTLISTLFRMRENYLFVMWWLKNIDWFFFFPLICPIFVIEEVSFSHSECELGTVLIFRVSSYFI